MLQKAALGALAMPFIGRRAYGTDSLEQEIGSMLIFGFNGARSAETLAGHLRDGRAGGVIFLGHNMGTRDEVVALTSRFRDSRPDALIAVDQEGGMVQRLSTRQGVDPFPRALEVPGRMTASVATEMYRAAGVEIARLGFNFNMAPVVDIHRSDNPIIARFGRAYSDDVEVIAEYAAACIAGYTAADILTSIKHFPGHGSSTGDTHEGPVDISASWRVTELRPYELLIRQGVVKSVMVGHLILRELFQSDLPATLSPGAIEGLLRLGLDYDGVVITDDLDMDAIRTVTPFPSAIVSAVAAGNDILLISNSVEQNPNLPENVVGWVAAAVADGVVSRDRITESAARVQRMRGQLPLAAAPASRRTAEYVPVQRPERAAAGVLPSAGNEVPSVLPSPAAPIPAPGIGPFDVFD